MRKYNNLNLPARQTGLILLIFFFLAYGISSITIAKGKKDNGKNNKPHISKTTADPTNSIMDINNATMWVTDAGFHDWVVASSWNGAFPKGMSVGAIFAQGIVWGGQVYDGASPTIRVNGNDYGSGTYALTRLFRVRPDYASADLTDDAANYNSEGLGSVTDAQISALKDQYAKDWQEWPAKEGAPYDDVNKDGKYDPSVDIPGIPGASQTLFIMYDDRNSVSLYSSPQIGLQIQETYWAYSYTGALGNVIYDKVDMIYKGTSSSSATSHIDSMYIVQWADPDVGNSGDDFAGCDTALNLGYSYTSQPTDAVYAGVGLAPPAVGFDFLQGVSQYTGNPADSAIFNLKWRKGYKYVNPKPMSSFIYFAAGGKWEDPDYNYTGTLQYYNLMRGFLPRPPYPSTEGFPESVADVTPFGTYLCDGDPVAGTGKLDGTADTPGDRRIMCVNGPLNVKLGDTLEVVTALIYGLGTDNLSSITALKSNDDAAQKVYDLLFQLPSIQPPIVQVGQFNQKIVLNWGNDLSSINKIENFADLNYNFEGYDVYQLRTASSSITDESNSVKLATYDLVNGVTNILDSVVNADGIILPVVVENGKDKGIQRYIELSTDAFTNQPLRNGQTYYYAVVSYAYNPAPLLPFHSLKSSVVIKACVPQKPFGVSLGSTAGDTIKVTHSGPGDGTALAIVVDPSLTTGDQYKVTFADDGSWGVTDVTTGSVRASGLTNQSGGENYPIIDGMIVKVFGPPPGMKEWTIPSGTRRFSWAGGFSGLGLEGFSGGDPTAYDQDYGTIGMAGHFAFGGIGTNLNTTDYHTVLLKLAPIDPVSANPWDPLTKPSSDNFSKGYRYLRSASSPAADPSFAQWIINAASGYPYQDYNYSIPLSAWDMETDPPTRLMVGFLENNVAGASVDGRYLPPQASSGDNTVNREFLFVFNVPYSETPDPSLQVNISGNSDIPLMWVGTFTVRTDVPWIDGDAQNGDQFEIVANHINTSADEFSFIAPANLHTNDLAKADLNKINVFPNPYYGYQIRETSRDNHYITFSHLPAKATIRIFDLSGVLVKTIRKSDPTQFTTWNLQNDSGYPVASGIYVAYIDLPDLGTTKILKIAIIQEQQILKVY